MEDSKLWQIIIVVVGMWAGLLQWAGVRTVKRVDDLEKTKADKTEVDHRLDSLHGALDRTADQLHSLHIEAARGREDILKVMSESNERLARIEGRMSKEKE